MVSAVVITKNEAQSLARCLKSLSWCSEVIVIDDNSTDTTRDIAKRFNAKIFVNTLSDFSSQRNFAFDKVKNDWVLFVDADEEVPESLREEILTVVTNTDKNGFYIERVDYMWGERMRFGDAGSTSLLRLGKKAKGKWKGKVHETWDITGQKGYISKPLLHYPHPTIREFLAEINLYSDIRANELFDAGVPSSLFAVIGYPKAKFFINYVLKLGFLDGQAGLVHAIMMSFYSFLVRGKLWLLWDRKSV